MRTLILLCCGILLPQAAHAQRRPTSPPTRRPATRPDTSRGRPRPAQQAPARRPARPPSEQTLTIDGGLARADLGFDFGPALGVTYRKDRGTSPFVVRAELDVSVFSQNATLVGVKQSEAKLQHFGVSGGVEWLLADRRAELRPYLVAGAGVFRFDGSGPAGDQGGAGNSVFASTTDVGASVGAGLRVSKWLAVEGRYLTVGDFYMIPITFSLTLWRGK